MAQLRSVALGNLVCLPGFAEGDLSIFGLITKSVFRNCLFLESLRSKSKFM